MRSLLALAVTLLSGCGGDCISPTGCDKYTPPTTSTSPPAVVVPGGSTSSPTESSIVLRVDGTASSADISYSGGGASGDVNNSPLPWQRTFTATKGDLLFVSGVNATATGTVRVLITSGGRTLKEASTNAPRGYTSARADCC